MYKWFILLGESRPVLIVEVLFWYIQAYFSVTAIS